MLLMYIKQNLSNIWSSIHGKGVAYKKGVYYFLIFFKKKK